MKKILLSLLFLFITTTVFAAPLPPKEDVQRFFDMAKEFRFYIESGINYKNYSEKATALNVEYKKFADKYPSSEFVTLEGKIVDAYKGSEMIWKSAIFDNEKFVTRESVWGQYVSKSYPSVVQKVKYESTLGWYYLEVIQEMWVVAKAREDEFKVKISESY